MKPVGGDMSDEQDLHAFPPGSQQPPGPPASHVQKIEVATPPPPSNLGPLYQSSTRGILQEALACSSSDPMTLGELPQIAAAGGASPRWGTMIPLMGGSAMGCERATGVRPLFHLSYTTFAANESHLVKAWPEVPRLLL